MIHSKIYKSKIKHKKKFKETNWKILEKLPNKNISSIRKKRRKIKKRHEKNNLIKLRP